MGADSEVLAHLRKFEGVQDAYQVYGVYDLVAKVTVDSTEKIKEIVTQKIRKMDKVYSTLTLIVY